MPTFLEQVEDPARGHAVDDKGTPTAMVAFGGLAGGMVIPPFEFFGLAGQMSVSKIFIRDIHQSWYSRGVDGLGSDLTGVAHGLRDLLDAMGAEPAVFGASAGGFAAIAASLIAGFPEVHAFGPQMSLRRGDRFKARDRRWGTNVRALRRAPAASRIDTLVDSLRSNTTTEVNIYVANDNRPDLGQVALLGEPAPPLVSVHRYDVGGHSFVRSLRDSGDLATILTGAVRRAEERASQGRS